MSLGIVLVGAAASAVLMQQALSARPPTGYQVPIVNLARQFGLAPARPALGANGQPRNFTAGGDGRFAAVAQILGESPEQLQVELSSASLTEVAIAHGADPDAVATAMKTASDQQIDDAVSSGRVSSDQAETRKAQADQRIDQLMTQVAPFGGGQQQRGPRRPGG